MFTENHEACVDVSVEVIEDIIDLVVKYKDDVPEYLTLLMNIGKVFNEPIKRNLKTIMELTMARYDEIAGFLTKKDFA